MADAVRRLVVGGIFIMVDVFCFLKEVLKCEVEKVKEEGKLLTHE